MFRIGTKFTRVAFVLTAALCGIASQSLGATLAEIKSKGVFRAAIQNEPPYAYITGDGEAKGLGPEVAAAVLKRLGIEQVDWVIAPFSSLIPGLRAGRWDMVAGQQTIKPERCEVVSFSNPMSTAGEALIVKAGNPKKLHSYDDIKSNPDTKVATQSGNIEITYFKAYGIPSDQVLLIPSNADAADTLNAGRADAYAMEDVSAALLLKSGAMPGFEVAAPFTQPKVNGKSVISFGGHTFRKEDEDFRQAYNKELAAFMKTPEFAEIAARNGLPKESTDRALTQTAEDRCAAK
jgi:polar amino acid transport system substrate-binding protein